jgi:hypothetical protein
MTTPPRWEKIKANPVWHARHNAHVAKYHHDKKAALGGVTISRARNIAAAGRRPPPQCEACGVLADESKKYGKLVFDHCHESGKFRGWICHNCNLILGKSGDNSMLLEQLATYLRKSKE